MRARKEIAIRKVSFEYIGKDEDIEMFFKSAISDYFTARNPVTNNSSTFVGSVENSINRGDCERLSRFI